MALHRSSKVLRKEEHILFQSPALRPEGPAEPSICWAMDRIIEASIWSKILGGVLQRKALTNRWGYCWLSWWMLVLEMFAVLPSGWRLSKGRLTLPWCSVINLIAALKLPIATSFSNNLAVLPSSWCWLLWTLSWLWIVLPSWTRVSRSPFFHFLSLLSRQLMPSLFRTWYTASGVAGWASPSLLSWLCSPMLWHHCMLLSVGITQRQNQYLPSPWELQTDFYSSLLILYTLCPPAMIESPHQYLPIQNWMQSRCRIAGDRQVLRIVRTHLCSLFIPIFFQLTNHLT